MADNETVRDVYNSLTPSQVESLNFAIGSLLDANFNPKQKIMAKMMITELLRSKYFA